MAGLIELAHLSVSFQVGGRVIRAVHDVSFAVAAGATFGIVGESGSGKSTVLKAIAGLVQADAPAIRIKGQMVAQKRSKADRRLMQFVFQDPYGSLHPRQTVDDILREPLEIHGLGDAGTKVAAALSEVGLGPLHRFRFPHQLSGGQRQRVSIARALILKPSILLLDEPTSALDVSIQAEILNLIARLRREYQLTSILVSHDLSVIAHMCERVAVMRHGELIEIVDVANLRAGIVQEAYTRDLLRSSEGYVRL
ncbi:ABC transporter ATP-binding protein [Methylovirgula sp. 4M-Z18]|uniref:ABC transporter ATP-binding protein n=1 Tax=Methylovirgula sp. 4M-Z18 TaxID=2293567 RepID=UPI000E2EE3A1|nr:ABC transporter ATP-binding protein [Methylovirgula sp. 4M-Z18]RFB78915.1 ABC transporter ATP-binding protein [Methylovirgula sp. 4M-Z18]